MEQVTIGTLTAKLREARRESTKAVDEIEDGIVELKNHIREGKKAKPAAPPSADPPKAKPKRSGLLLDDDDDDDDEDGAEGEE